MLLVVLRSGVDAIAPDQSQSETDEPKIGTGLKGGSMLLPGAAQLGMTYSQCLELLEGVKGTIDF